MFANGRIVRGIEYREDGSVRYEGRFSPDGLWEGENGIEFFKSGGRAYAGPHVRGQRQGKKCALFHVSPANVCRFRGEIRPGEVCWKGYEYDAQGRKKQKWINGILMDL